MPRPVRDITGLLKQVSDGDAEALDRLVPLVYAELKEVAHRQLRAERQGHTLNTTALVNEAYLKLVASPPNVEWRDRAHFFHVAGRAMRQVLVNYAKARVAQKRGGGAAVVELDEAVVMPDERAAELVALDEALHRLEKMNARQAKVVEHRYFTGLTIAETAELLGVAVATVNRDWTTARLWLHSEVARDLESVAADRRDT